MIINGSFLLEAAPIKGMVDHKVLHHGVTYGLGEAGYDIRIKQDIQFKAHQLGRLIFITHGIEEIAERRRGRFALASALEEFDMPNNLTGIVHDKSTWARRGLSVFNTVIEPGWKGYLTLELVYHGEEDLIIPAGAGIAQVIFHENKAPALYKGKYQNQEDKPVSARESL